MMTQHVAFVCFSHFGIRAGKETEQCPVWHKAQLHREGWRKKTTEVKRERERERKKREGSERCREKGWRW